LAWHPHESLLPLQGGDEEDPQAKLRPGNASRAARHSFGECIAQADAAESHQEYGLPTTGDKAALESRVQEWIILWNSNLDTSHPQSLGALRAKLNQTEASRRRDKERGKDALGQQLGTKDGMDKYAKEKKGEFERLRQEIMERDKRRAQADKGSGADSPIEVD
jgi:E3 ubiquitin-protein ligase RAD18